MVFNSFRSEEEAEKYAKEIGRGGDRSSPAFGIPMRLLADPEFQSVMGEAGHAFSELSEPEEDGEEEE